MQDKKTLSVLILLMLIAGGIFIYTNYMSDTNQQNNTSENTNDIFPRPIIKDGITYTLVGKEEITRLYLLDGTEETENGGYNITLVATKRDGSTKWSTQIFSSQMSSPEFLKTVITEFVLEGNHIKISGETGTKMIDIQTGEIKN